MLNNLKFRLVVFVLLLAMSPLFFIDILDNYFGVATAQLWNLGHIFYFLLLTLGLLGFKTFQSVKTQMIYVGLIVVVGVSIEIIQLWVGRSASVLDVIRNVAGVAIGFSLVYRKQLPKMVVIVVLLAPIFDVYSFVTKFQLHLLIQNRSPLIEDFESNSTYKFWTHPDDIINNSGSIKNNALRFKSAAGKKLKIYMSPTVRDWSEYGEIQFTIFNRNNEFRKITFHASDELHDKGDHHGNDVFRKEIMLASGDNTIVISMQEIEHPSGQRKIKLDEMLRVGFVYDGFEESVDLLIDDIQLINR